MQTIILSQSIMYQNVSLSHNIIITTMYIITGEQARHYQGCTNSSWCGIYIYVWRYVCHNSSACHTYVMWAEIGHYHFLYVPAVLNIVTIGNGTGTKNVLKWNRALGFELSIHPIFCLPRYYYSESKPILYQDTVYCKFLLYNMCRN